MPRLGDSLTSAPVAAPDEVVSAFLTPSEEPADWSAEPDQTDATDSDDEAVVAGTLRSPWKWEELIVESAVVGGRSRADGEARWRRRLDGLAADFRYRIDELRRDEPESARIGRFERDLRNLGHLRDFALPIVGELATWADPRRGASGWIGSRRWRRECSTGPRACCRRWPIFVRWPTSGR